ncbi:MAG: family 10 glycosylhydrolase [Verrucomicrobia bacterium]|nr:family 10 glycosylhydrolase [Verrucomicrobiota bacterium]MBU4246954.1 family 10 glycosylhydrolase [Verrucomicrobiota bacterium]MBU4291338.1 family 10 glycosylhydrolase [Verrucomicrobiota bacterium]MBU4498085.1 family 10 glycosylhydrolase [Verrucomicrobiota bacterium]MCG2680040.1 family 10 glycosylhydrolase [Kiritimatiellia bacterium]
MKYGYKPVRSLLVRLALLGLLAAGSVRADQIRTIDIFSPKNVGGSDAGWRAGPGAPAVRADTGTPAGLRFSCPFQDNIPRVFWDRTVALDLSHYSTLELDITCARPEAIQSVGLYLKSGDGWHLWLPRLKFSGRQKISFSLHAAATEGRPSGWDAIKGVRLSFTKAADIPAEVTVHSLRVRSCDIAVVSAVDSAPNPDERNASRSAASRLSRWLNDLGIPHTVIDDTQVINGSLDSARVAILPYNPYPPRRELRALASFVKRGGKLIVFYAAEPRLAKLLDMTVGDYQAAPKPGQWSSFAFNRNAPAHTPAVIFQTSSNIRPVYPADTNARVIATWRTADGAALSDPAWVRSDHGFWMSHILLDGDDGNKKDLLLALLGSLNASVWKDAAERAWITSGNVASFQGLPAALAGIRRLDENDTSESLLTQVEALDDQMRSCVARQQYPEVVDTGRDLKAALVRAYAGVQQPRSPEFRGVWNHTGTGLYPGNWNATCQALSESGFTAVFPNLAWAGTAHYASQYVPASSTARKYGDQLKQSAAAARRYGLELHVWKICWNLGQAPDSLVDQLRKAGRLQKTDDRQTLKWLCPTHPENIAQELNMISELITSARVDGIHLDYMRYPSAHACFCSGCRQRFEQWRGRSVRDWPDSVKSGELKDSFATWRRNQITGFLRSTRDLLRRRNPGIKLSAAVYPNYPECSVGMGQDWGLWLKEGLVDFVCPMDYADDSAAFKALVRRQTMLPKSRGRVFPGIGVTATESRLAPDQVIEQILQVRSAGAGGFMLFDLNRTLEKDVLPILSLGVTRTDR